MEAIKSRYHRFLTRAVQDIRFQFMSPIESKTGYVVTKLETRATKPIYSALFKRMNMTPDHYVLEIGFGRGTGIWMAFETVFDGDGHVFGTELSHYAADVTIDALEEHINKKVTIVRNGVFNFLPFPSNYFNHVFHVDVFYAWNRRDMQEICGELFRVLKPGCRIICGMELERLHKLARWKVLTKADYDPMRYIDGLEESGFEDIRVDYERVDRRGNPCEEDEKRKRTREIQLIHARKPLDSDEFDSEAIMKRLEEEVKRIELETSIEQIGGGKSRREREEIVERKMTDEEEEPRKIE